LTRLLKINGSVLCIIGLNKQSIYEIYGVYISWRPQLVWAWNLY